jgi:PhnB protein
MRMALPGGRIVHAEIELSDNHVWLAEEAPELAFPGPETLGGAGAMVYAYVRDVDETCARAVAAGAEILRPLADQTWGDRTVTLRDPFGHVWTLATRKERLTLDEARRRSAAGA